MRIRLDRPVRSSIEATWWLELRPCPDCGALDDDIAGVKSNWAATEWPDEGSGDLRSSGWFDVACCNCGSLRQILFYEVDTAMFWRWSMDDGSIAGPTPSQIIGPHEFVAELLRVESLLPTDVATAEGDIWKHAGRRCGRARSCVTELLKFLPPGTNEIGAEHFWDDAGRAVRAAHPERFRREWIEAHGEKVQVLREAIRVESERRHADGRDRYDPRETVEFLRKVRVPERIIAETMGAAASSGVQPFSDASIESHRRWLADTASGSRLEARDTVAIETRLSALDLSGAIFERVTLDRADLSFTRFHAAKMSEVSARGASFASAMLAGTTISRCQFEGAGMPVANLGDADVTDTDFTAANLERTTWYRSKVSRCSFAAAGLADTGLDKAVFTDCDFRCADLGLVRGLLGNSMDARFVRCDLRDTNWLDRDLFRVAFVDCRLAGARGIPILSETVFERPDLSPAGDGSQIGTIRDVMVQFGIDPDNPRASITKRTTYLFTAGERAQLDDELRKVSAAVLDESRFTDSERGEMVNVTVREPMDTPFQARFDALLAPYRASLVPPPTERDLRHRHLAEEIIEGSLDRGETFDQTVRALMLAGFTRDEALEAMTRTGDGAP